ncbi:hypothetical protein [Ralstonia phage RP31]|uniref:Uncharacterized protein n=2 Tax=Ripduovirus RP12 TaxID=2560700 RepID=A0A1L7N0T8_9CAUD|nr:hypothetical protein FDH28_gp101 [Ralstonia phage RP12]BAW19075.1 hypothetical protein [Ralstonia phage RP12]BAW19360.1 hypothetical protein [Ralstonia phage RP31]
MASPKDKKLILNALGELVTPEGWKNVPASERQTIIANEVKMAKRKGITVTGIRTGNSVVPVKSHKS